MWLVILVYSIFAFGFTVAIECFANMNNAKLPFGVVFILMWLIMLLCGIS